MVAGYVLLVCRHLFGIHWRVDFAKGLLSAHTLFHASTDVNPFQVIKGSGVTGKDNIVVQVHKCVVDVAGIEPAASPLGGVRSSPAELHIRADEFGADVGL